MLKVSSKHKYEAVALHFYKNSRNTVRPVGEACGEFEQLPSGLVQRCHAMSNEAPSNIHSNGKNEMRVTLVVII